MSEGFQAITFHKIGHNSRKKLETQGEKLKTQGKNSKLKEKTQGFGKTKNAVCRKLVEKKGCVT